MLPATAARRGAAGVVATPLALAARHVEEINSLAVDLRQVAGALLRQLHPAVIYGIKLHECLTFPFHVLSHRVSNPSHPWRSRRLGGERDHLCFAPEKADSVRGLCLPIHLLQHVAVGNDVVVQGGVVAHDGLEVLLRKADLEV